MHYNLRYVHCLTGPWRQESRLWPPQKRYYLTTSRSGNNRTQTVYRHVCLRYLSDSAAWKEPWERARKKVGLLSEHPAGCSWCSLLTRGLAFFFFFFSYEFLEKSSDSKACPKQQRQTIILEMSTMNIYQAGNRRTVFTSITQRLVFKMQTDILMLLTGQPSTGLCVPVCTKESW